MAPPKRRPAGTFREQALALVAGAWSELGVSGWTTTHDDWAIDPEPLIVFTAWFGDEEPRLRDEVTDWCIRYWRFVSKARLKNLVRSQPDDVAQPFGEFAATVGFHAGVAWPHATEPRRFRVTGRSALPPLERPSLAWVRLRAMFGLGARTEILRCFLSMPDGAMSVARLAEVTGYTKRNVADGCDALVRAGVLSMRERGNRFSYSLARRSALEAFVGEIAPIRPNWTAMLNVARELVTLERRAGEVSQKAFPVHVRKSLRALADDLDELELVFPLDDVRGTDLWPALRAAGSTHLGAWSVGRRPAVHEEAARVSRLRAGPR